MICKHPLETRYYVFGFSQADEIVNNGDTIASVTSIFSGLTGTTADLTFGSNSINIAKTQVGLLVSGGVDGLRYPIYCEVATTMGAIIVQSFDLFVTVDVGVTIV